MKSSNIEIILYMLLSIIFCGGLLAINFASLIPVNTFNENLNKTNCLLTKAEYYYYNCTINHIFYQKCQNVTLTYQVYLERKIGADAWALVKKSCPIDYKEPLCDKKWDVGLLEICYVKKVFDGEIYFELKSYNSGIIYLGLTLLMGLIICTDRIVSKVFNSCR